MIWSSCHKQMQRSGNPDPSKLEEKRQLSCCYRLCLMRRLFQTYRSRILMKSCMARNHTQQDCIGSHCSSRNVFDSNSYISCSRSNDPSLPTAAAAYITNAEKLPDADTSPHQTLVFEKPRFDEHQFQRKMFHGTLSYPLFWSYSTLKITRIFPHCIPYPFYDDKTKFVLAAATIIFESVGREKWLKTMTSVIFS